MHGCGSRKFRDSEFQGIRVEVLRTPSRRTARSLKDSESQEFQVLRVHENFKYSESMNCAKSCSVALDTRGTTLTQNEYVILGVRKTSRQTQGLK